MHSFKWEIENVAQFSLFQIFSIFFHGKDIHRANKMSLHKIMYSQRSTYANNSTIICSTRISNLFYYLGIFGEEQYMLSGALGKRKSYIFTALLRKFTCKFQSSEKAISMSVKIFFKQEIRAFVNRVRMLPSHKRQNKHLLG